MASAPSSSSQNPGPSTSSSTGSGGSCPDPDVVAAVTMRKAMGSLLDNVGFTHAHEGPLNVLTDVAVRFMEKLCREVKLSGEYCGRSQPAVEDLALAFKAMKFDQIDFHSYLSQVSSIAPVPPLPLFPVDLPHKRNRINGYKASREEKKSRPPHIPRFLPGVRPSGEEKEEAHAPVASTSTTTVDNHFANNNGPSFEKSKGVYLSRFESDMPGFLGAAATAYGMRKADKDKNPPALEVMKEKRSEEERRRVEEEARARREAERRREAPEENGIQGKLKKLKDKEKERVSRPPSTSKGVGKPHKEKTPHKIRKEDKSRTNTPIIRESAPVLQPEASNRLHTPPPLLAAMQPRLHDIRESPRPVLDLFDDPAEEADIPLPRTPGNRTDSPDEPLFFDADPFGRNSFNGPSTSTGRNSAFNGPSSSTGRISSFNGPSTSTGRHSSLNIPSTSNSHSTPTAADQERKRREKEERKARKEEKKARKAEEEATREAIRVAARADANLRERSQVQERERKIQSMEQERAAKEKREREKAEERRRAQAALEAVASEKRKEELRVKAALIARAMTEEIEKKQREKLAKEERERKRKEEKRKEKEREERLREEKLREEKLREERLREERMREEKIREEKERAKRLSQIVKEAAPRRSATPRVETPKPRELEAIRAEEDKEDSSTIPFVMEDESDGSVAATGPTTFPLNMSLEGPFPRTVTPIKIKKHGEGEREGEKSKKKHKKDKREREDVKDSSALTEEERRRAKKEKKRERREKEERERAEKEKRATTAIAPADDQSPLQDKIDPTKSGLKLTIKLGGVSSHASAPPPLVSTTPVPAFVAPTPDHPTSLLKLKIKTPVDPKMEAVASSSMPVLAAMPIAASTTTPAKPRPVTKAELKATPASMPSLFQEETSWKHKHKKHKHVKASGSDSSSSSDEEEKRKRRERKKEKQRLQLERERRDMEERRERERKEQEEKREREKEKERQERKEREKEERRERERQERIKQEREKERQEKEKRDREREREREKEKQKNKLTAFDKALNSASASAEKKKKKRKQDEQAQQQTTDETIWICPACSVAYVDGAEMIACDCCDSWFHWNCVGIAATPLGEWFCEKCLPRNGEKPNYGENKKKCTHWSGLTMDWNIKKSKKSRDY